MDSRCWEAFAPALWPYVALFEAVLERRVTPQEFEVVFLTLYKNDPTSWPPSVFSALESVFGAVDEYCEDEALRADVHGLGEDDVLAEVERCLKRLREMQENEDRSAL